MNKIETIIKIHKTFSRLEQQFQREPSSEEVAILLEISEKLVADASKVSTHHVSMDAPINGELGDNLYDVLLNEDSLSPDNGLMNNSLRKEIERLLYTLSPRESTIIRYYFGLNNHSQHSLEEIGEKLGMTRERIRQIKEKALRKLRNNYKNRLLKSFL